MGQTLTFIEYISVHKKLTLSGQVCSELLDWQKKKKNHLGFSIRSYENLKWIFDQPNTNVTLSLQVLEVTGSIIVLTLKGWLSLWRLDELMYLSDRLVGNTSFLSCSFSSYLTHQPLPFIPYFSYTHLISIAQHISTLLSEVVALPEKLLHWHLLMINSKATSSLLFPPMPQKLPCTYLYFQSNLNGSTVNTLYITVINSLWVFWRWWLCFISFLYY